MCRSISCISGEDLERKIWHSDEFEVSVSENSGTPKSSILIGVFHYKPSILGYHYFWKHLGGFLVT